MVLLAQSRDDLREVPRPDRDQTDIPFFARDGLQRENYLAGASFARKCSAIRRSAGHLECLYPLGSSTFDDLPSMRPLFVIGIAISGMLPGCDAYAAALGLTPAKPKPDNFEPDEQWACGGHVSFLLDDDVSVTLAADVDARVGTVEIANSAVAATYTRFEVDGLDRRWDWCVDEDGEFLCAFIIGPKGDGGYYKFDPDEEKAKPSDLFACARIRPDEAALLSPGEQPSGDAMEESVPARNNQAEETLIGGREEPNQPLERLEEARREFDRAMNSLRQLDQPGPGLYNLSNEPSSAPQEEQPTLNVRSEAAPPRHYQCRALLTDEPGLLLEPPSKEGSSEGKVTLHGRTMRVDYRRIGLTEHWTLAASFSIKLTPNLMASYEDSQMEFSFFRCALVVSDVSAYGTD